MTGPGPVDDALVEPPGPTPGPDVEVLPSREATVGAMTVRRALPRRGRRTLGAWCFADHMGPASVDRVGSGIGPHPHTGLQTVTWLRSGQLTHRDSLGTEQTIRSGQLNLMTAGHGVSHAEETAGTGDLEGIQLWVAQPESTRHGPAAFEHHADLPRLELDHGTATVLVGRFGGSESPARADTDHLGVELELRAGSTALPVDPTHEHGLVVLSGRVSVGANGPAVGPGHLVRLAPGTDELTVDATEAAIVMLLGGAPFESEILMWWNFVARTRDEIEQARNGWNEPVDDGRFGDPGSSLERIPAPALPWARG